MKDESVLCVRPSRLADCGIIGQGFIPFGHEVQMYRFLDGCRDFIPRALCETDESWRQVIPYIVGISKDAGLFTYLRAEAGGESRLHRLRSLGIGGHVNVADGAGEGGRKSFLAAVRREVKEEVLYDKTLSSTTWIGMINDPSNPVGRVHLGIVGILSVRKGPILAAPGNDHFDDCRSLSYVEAMQWPSADWESWSRLTRDAIMGRPALWSPYG